MKIYILHPGKANYPEITAYRSFFNDKFEVLDGTIDDYNLIDDKEHCILWCIMGYYPSDVIAHYIIHDYRSLSVGRFPRAKDMIKKIRNAKPHLRIFQNESMEKIMNFKDGIPSLKLPMGVPDWIFNLKPNNSLPTGTFCYIGEISSERGMNDVITAFTNSAPSHASLILVGHPEVNIKKNHEHHKNIIFTGKLPQEQALQIVLNCTYAICKFPKHYPHCYQAPTKFLEYAALKKTIICNKSPSNIKAAQEIKSNVIFTEKEEIFSNDLFIKLKYFTANNYPTQKSLTWPSVIKKSRIEDVLHKIPTQARY